MTKIIKLFFILAINAKMDQLFKRKCDFVYLLKYGFVLNYINYFLFQRAANSRVFGRLCVSN